MLIEDELVQFLERSIRPSSNKQRDTQMVLFHYGFGDASWPTLEEVATKFNLKNRERARQIIATKFHGLVRGTEFPTAALAASVIEEVDFTPCSELMNSLLRLGVHDRPHPRDLLNYLQDLGLCGEFDVYDANLNAITRSTLGIEAECFLIRSSRIPPLRSARKAAVTLPGLLGLAKVGYIMSELAGDDPLLPHQVLSLLEADPEVCFIEESGERWFAIEDRDNTLINNCEKIFGVISRCDIDVLATTLENSLSRRSVRLDYPTIEAIGSFLRNSKRFDVQDHSVGFLGNSTALTKIEQDVVAYLRQHRTVDYPMIRDYLLSKGYGKPHVDKAITCSPLVHVDKSLGRTRYTYSLVPEVDLPESQQTGIYQSIRERLQRVHEPGTDINCETTRRREQHILQNWLFSGKDVEQCAICGRTFSCSALVAAHKKPRSSCSEAERLDPYIVMPLCVFGCDYLYERRHLVVTENFVALGLALSETHEASFASSLVGRRVPDQWLRGDPTYFTQFDTVSTFIQEEDQVHAES